MVVIKDGNIAEASETIIGHQVNCLAAASGIDSINIRKAFPKVFEAYKVFCEANGFKPEKLLGTSMTIWTGTKCVANLFGQTYCGKTGRFTNYKALHTAMKKMASYAKSMGESVALPYGIGAREGGGDWEIIYNIIAVNFKDYKISLYKGGDW